MVADYTTWSGIVIGACGGFAASVSFAVTQWIVRVIKEKRDKKVLYNWLKENSKNSDPLFRSTRVLASYNNMTKDRVRYICSLHPLIHMSVGEKPDMWSIKEREPEFIFLGAQHRNNKKK